MARRTGGISLQQLHYFVEVASEGSISAAADLLYVAQPTMSAAMKDLETRVGRALLVRVARGVTLTTEGTEFLGYARQVIEQVALLEQRYLGRPPSRRLLGVSTQHYSFAVDAFVRMVRGTEGEKYEFSLRETRTRDIIEDVRTLRSELGILYRNDFNRDVIDKILRDAGLAFHPLFLALPHIFVSRRNPLASRERVTLADLADLPRLTFDQGADNSFYFAEEILSTLSSDREIRVSDRATIFNLMIGLDGYTISTGIISDDLDPAIVAVPLDVDERIEIGWIGHSAIPLTEQARRYLTEVRAVVTEGGLDLLG
ncbi:MULTISPECIES: LysR family transcriptional regulator [Rathayibacter]|jgi:DNA-binding transcriptional LysR family regulator|uniref:LysR family transcriptional regulator n=1 Tax=Rathayibacter festucae TaxID=110937 RepID=A0ABX6GYZ3_9MICO|nr:MULTISPECIES: LysR family transcriptional regulator [Rathayibacter]MCJ1674508.1 LysR family transcriptional regulator [Rathayibacter sp. VKM Ac-2929]MCJ1684789.1 LysR family transcriptional regulator [Rathayibacter sp. VKM Ac-2928]MCJ1687425.1 LysR family transcriptional regulator [Rathayibacter sp. VKM Ac-2927]QHC62753.1 LysR family transcriptional regulator [Rathayibacter festucae]ROP50131.1 DNA-binding transcriptional LysR family regulator [Rathayibacter sp. PhB186]